MNIIVLLKNKKIKILLKINFWIISQDTVKAYNFPPKNREIILFVFWQNKIKKSLEGMCSHCKHFSPWELLEKHVF